MPATPPSSLAHKCVFWGIRTHSRWRRVVCGQNAALDYKCTCLIKLRKASNYLNQDGGFKHI